MFFSWPARFSSWFSLGLSCVCAAVSSAETAPPPPKLLAPGALETVKRNTPTLAWSAKGADEVELWIDDRKTEVLPAYVEQWVPFPLSFGEHTWKVVARKGTERIDSPRQTFVVDDAPLRRLPEGAVLLRHGWKVQSSLTVTKNGAALSTQGAQGTGWSITSLPATVLTSLVRSGVYPNPYVGLNNLLIPDANDAANAKYSLLQYSHIPGHNPWSAPYWYVNSFTVPASYKGKRIWLNIGELNYRANVWVNGKQVATSDQWVGMEQTFRVDITEALQGKTEHSVAISVAPLDTPGEPAPPAATPLADPGRNMGADAEISRNYTKWDAIGWDWQPEIRDRDVGITEDVFLEATEPVEVREGYAGASVSLEPQPSADLFISFVTANHGGDELKADALVDISCAGAPVASVTIPVQGKPHSETTTTLDASRFPSLRLNSPRLWWPYGMGEQVLHDVSITLRQGSTVLSKQSFKFGIRKIDTSIDPKTESRRFWVNGQPFYGQGGNWVIDMMLNWTASRYDEEIRIARASGLNFLRIWGPTGAPPTALYEAADREGVLIQQDFLHDFWGTERNTPGFVPEEGVFRRASTEIIKRYRNHPSLFIWCGGNEGPNPREVMLKDELLPQFDPAGGRFYLLGSDRDGLKGGGPYHTLSPSAYFTHPKLSQFNSEIGPSGVPEIESLLKFLRVPTRDWAPGRFPLDGEWAQHDANDRPEDDRKYSHFDDLVRRTYGQVASEDLAGFRSYARKAQWVNFDAYRAAIEALNKHFDAKNTGFSLWKFNGSWPSLTWQITDWYQQLHAGFYAVKLATRPLHVQLNADDFTVTVVNREGRSLSASRVEAELFAPDGKSLGVQSASVAALTSRYASVALQLTPTADLRLVRLRWVDANGKVWAENNYWQRDQQDLSAALQLAPTTLQAQLVRTAQGWQVTVRNAGSVPAPLVRLQLLEARSGVEPLPNLWSDNYLTLLPGETRVVTVEAPSLAAAALRLSGDNVATQVITAP